MNVRDLEPKVVWNYFEDLNEVPRPSKKEERVIAFAKQFGENLGLETYVDGIGNVIIKKPATPGYENRKTVILQAHLDMVHQKNNDTDFDFLTQGIQSYIDGDWVSAKGTTLGADNGMGVAAIMGVLASKDMEHPPVEALFTIDEETGMTGAIKLEQGKLKGKILLNLDTEDDDEFSIGCAGGIDTNTHYDYHLVPPKSGSKTYRISVKGLKGGHSGMDIHLGRANANKVMNRLLYQTEKYGLQIGEINGGSLRNAIPRESFSIIAITDTAYLEEFKKRADDIRSEYKIVETEMLIDITETDLPEFVVSDADAEKILQSIYSVHNGVYKMSASVEGLVETSSSLARVLVQDGAFTTQSLQRSSVESSKLDIAHTVGAVFKLMGCTVEHSGSYPGWEPNVDSEILQVMKNNYTSLFKDEPKVKACHAGLECGILKERYPHLDMISFGPTIRNAHSPDEKVHIASVAKFWDLLKESLKHIPEN